MPVRIPGGRVAALALVAALLRQALANGAGVVARLMVEDCLAALPSRPGHLG